jgi:hypothetical protein
VPSRARSARRGARWQSYCKDERIDNERRRRTRRRLTLRSDDVDKCIGCHFFDRQAGKQADNRGMSWGQCRRAAPMLHPINQKTYMIEGVWPTVRDDDWCGEWKAALRRSDPARIDPARVNDLLGTPLSSPLPMNSVPRINAQTARAALGVLGVDTPALFPGVAANGRGND